MIDLFKTKEINEFAKTLAQDFFKRYPLSDAETPKNTEKKLKVVTAGLYARAIRFRQEKNLGIFKKAKLGNVFKWELKELGYSEDLIEAVTKGLIVSLAAKDGIEIPGGQN